MDRDLFAGVDGGQVAAHYYDWMMIAADSCAPVSALNKVLPSDKPRPVQVMPDVASVSLMAMEYRQIDR